MSGIEEDTQEVESGVGEEIPAMVFIIDESAGLSRVAGCNTAAVRELGFPRESLVGRPMSELMTERVSGAHEFRKSDGGTLRTVTVMSPRKTSGGGSLATLVAVPLPAPIDADQSAKLSALGDLAHHVVHELNQPLSVIRMALGTARRKLRMPGEIDVDFLEAKLDRMDSQCMRAAAIAETMRVFMPRDRRSLVPLEVERAIENALSMSAPLFRKLNVPVETTLGPACYVEGNEMHLEPVLLCVFGEIHDRIERISPDSPHRVTLTTRLIDGARLEILISDDVGNPDEAAIDDIAGSPVSLGLPLGLGVELVGELNGRFERRPGPAGTMYRIELPTIEVRDDSGTSGTG